MNPAIKPTETNPPGAHLRLVSDRAAGAASGITLSGVSKTYRSRDGDVPSLRPLDFHINEGEFFVVVGPSGCGKSTLLKMISGLLAPSTGEILVEGEPVTKPHGNVGIVFQNALLLPWRNILGNVMLPIDMKRLPREEYLVRAKALLKLVGLEGFFSKPSSPTSFNSALARTRYSSRGNRFISIGSITLPRMLRQGSSRAFWNTMPTLPCGFVTGSPSTRISPVDGASRPEIIFKSVDLPQPDGPTTTKNSPSLM